MSVLSYLQGSAPILLLARGTLVKNDGGKRVGVIQRRRKSQLAVGWCTVPDLGQYTRQVFHDMPPSMQEKGDDGNMAAAGSQCRLTASGQIRGFQFQESCLYACNSRLLLQAPGNTLDLPVRFRIGGTVRHQNEGVGRPTLFRDIRLHLVLQHGQHEAVFPHDWSDVKMGLGMLPGQLVHLGWQILEDILARHQEIGLYRDAGHALGQQAGGRL